MSGPGDLGFDLLPPDPGLISPDLALEAALAPVVDLGTPADAPLGKGWSFDFLTGQFIRHGSSPAEVYDLDNLRVWIEKTLRTARFAHPIYGDQYGIIEPYALIGQPYSSELIGAYQEAVVEALTAHDRIAAVDSFYFQHDPMDDALLASFQVTLDGESQDVIEVNSLPLGIAS